MHSENMRGALVMVLAMAAFTINDSLVKATGGALPLSQLLVVRGVITAGLLTLFAMRMGGLRLQLARSDMLLVLVRTLSEIAAAYFFLTALLHMDFANVTAILQVLPLTVTLGGALLFRESVGWKRLGAICAGFIGIMMIVQPGGDGFSLYSLYALAAVVAVTLRDLATRRVSSAVPSITVTLAAAYGVVLFAGVESLVSGVPWVALDARLWGLVVGAAVVLIFAYWLSVQAMRVGEVSFVSPFRYTAILFALFIGWLFFDEWPNSLALFGAVIVVASGLFTLWREQALRQKSRESA